MQCMILDLIQDFFFKGCKGCFGDDWRNFNMDYILDIIASILNSLGMTIYYAIMCCSYVLEGLYS